MSVRDSFVEHFGEDQAIALELAADTHVILHDDGSGLDHSQDNRGSDPFKYVLLAVIGWQCVTKYASHHGITIPTIDFTAWLAVHGELDTFDGDQPDRLASLINTLNNLSEEATIALINQAKEQGEP